MGFNSFAQLAQPPSFGYDINDMGGGGVATAYAPPAAMASIGGSIGVQDLAVANATVDVSAPLRGFLVGIAILIGIRVFWEIMD